MGSRFFRTLLPGFLVSLIPRYRELVGNCADHAIQPKTMGEMADRDVASCFRYPRIVSFDFWRVYRIALNEELKYAML